MKTTPLTVEQLQLLPEETRLDLIRGRSEDQWFDRKSHRVSPRDLGDCLVSFANADGGLLAIGMHKKVLEGVSAAGTRIMNEWRQAAMNFTEPPVRHKFELLPCVNANGAADQLVIIEIEVSDHVHKNVKGETYLRIGDENRKLSLRETQELEFDKGQSVFDGQAVPTAERSDLDEARVAAYLMQLLPPPAMDRTDEVLEARGLIVRHKGTIKPTVAGVLLLGRDPERFFPEATIRVLRYRGLERGTGSRLNVERDTPFGGTLPEQIASARKRTARLLPAAMRFRESEGRFRQSAVIPQAAWLEAIVNAAVHRSYSLGGDHIRVEIFSNRLEVESPGRLPGLVRIENIRSTRFARNPRVARAMADLRYGRELGEGVNRMFEEMERAGFPAPIYTQSPASVRVTFLFESVFGRILNSLPPGSERLVEFLSRRGRVTTTEAMHLLDMSRPTALNWIGKLRRLGLLDHVGSSLKDPRGFWQPNFAPQERARRVVRLRRRKDRIRESRATRPRHEP